MSNHEPLIQLVDKDDVPLRGGTMDEAQLHGEWHRVVRIMVFDTIRKLYLLQKVPTNPYYNSGHWNTSASGHVDVGETYEAAAHRELAEEMGLSGLELEEVEQFASEEVVGERTYRRHNKTFVGQITSDRITLNPNPNEVADILWISRVGLLSMRDRGVEPMTGGLKRFAGSLEGDIDGN